MGFIFVTLLLDMVSFGMVIPVLPLLIVQLEGGSFADATAIAGLFGTAWAAMQFFCSPIQGALSDKYGRRPVLLLSMAGLGLDKIFMAMAPTLPILFIGRLISGATAASFSTTAAYVADISDRTNRARNFGYLSGAISAGFIIGPAIGGYLGSPTFAALIGVSPEEALRIPFWAAAIMCLLNAAWGYFVLPESLPKEKRSGFSWARANPVGSLRLLLSTQALMGLAGVAVLYQMAQNVFPSTFALYAAYRYGWTSDAIGLCLGLVGVTGLVVSMFAVQPFVRRFGERAAMIFGLGCMVTALTLYASAPFAAAFLIGVPFGALSGLYGPASQSLMTQKIDPTAQGQLQGALASIMGLTGMIGPTLYTGALAAGIQPGPGAAGYLPGAAFFTAAGFALTACALSFWVTRAQRETAAAPEQGRS